MKLFSVIVITVSFLMIAGCSSPEVVPNSGPHPPVSPAEVGIYQTPPMKYEVIGVVSLEITPALRWDENGNANAAFDKLREKAGAIGANALLLDSNMSGATYTVNAGYYGTSYQVPMHRNPVTAEALAIYVIKN